MKKLLLLLLCVPFIGLGQNVNIPDANFKSYLVGDPSINTNGDVEIQLSEATSFNGQIQCSGMTISDLTGIEAFTALSILICNNNQLTTLDVSNNTALHTLRCFGNQLTSLDVSGCTALTELFCNNNQLTSFNLNGATALNWLECNDNQLTSLNINSPYLDIFDCSNNLITSLNIYGWPDLTMYDCSNNQLTSLDLSNITSIHKLDCKNNQLTSLDVQHLDIAELWCQDNKITALDLSGTSYLSALMCKDNQLTTLDIRNMGNDPVNMVFNSLNNPNLTCINIDSNWIYTATLGFWQRDTQHYFSNNCPPPSSIEEQTSNKELLKITDILGRETKEKKNTPLFYIYDDGTVEKKLIIE